MQFQIIGHPTDGPTLDLDHERFAYAGKFVMSTTGKSVARENEDIIGAVAFNEDHSEPDTVRFRYVTVREDRQGERIGPRLLRYTAEKITADTVQIAVNNPIAYQACYRAGFTYTGDETGIAEVLLSYTPVGYRSPERYQDGLAVFKRRDLPPEQQSVLQDQLDTTPPDLVSIPG